eukprot:6842023-Karenia_brevis.AAC.1
MDVRCMVVARDFKGGDKWKDDVFAETPPQEANEASRAVTRRGDGRVRTLISVNAGQAPLKPKWSEDVYIRLPEECGAGLGVRGKLNRWVYGSRPAAKAGAGCYTEKLEGLRFRKGDSCDVVFDHQDKDVSLVIHNDAFTVLGWEEDLDW